MLPLESRASTCESDNATVLTSALQQSVCNGVAHQSWPYGLGVHRSIAVVVSL